MMAGNMSLPRHQLFPKTSYSMGAYRRGVYGFKFRKQMHHCYKNTKNVYKYEKNSTEPPKSKQLAEIFSCRCLQRRISELV